MKMFFHKVPRDDSVEAEQTVSAEKDQAIKEFN